MPGLPANTMAAVEAVTLSAKTVANMLSRINQILLWNTFVCMTIELPSNSLTHEWKTLGRKPIRHVCVRSPGNAHGCFMVPHSGFKV
jgi:hypothetical protein